MFKDGSWFVEVEMVGDGRTEELAWTWVEDTVKVEGLVTTTECLLEGNRKGIDGGEGFIATVF